MEIIAQDHGINWTTYHWITVDGNRATVTKTESFHKFNESQGAKDHPKTEWTVDFYRLVPMDDKWPLHHREQRLAHNAEIRAKYGFDETVTEYCVLRRNGWIEGFFAVARETID